MEDLKIEDYQYDFQTNFNTILQALSRICLSSRRGRNVRKS